MKKIIFSFLILTLLFLSSCDSLKRGLTGQKKDSSEEFLVKKKDPLVFPPRWGELPKPSAQVDDNNDEEKIEISLNQVQQDQEENIGSNNSGSTESIILKRIKNRQW